MTIEATAQQKLRTVHREVKQCAALTGLMRAQICDATTDRYECELIGLSADLADRVYHYFWESPGYQVADDANAASLAGKLRAVIAAMIDLNTRIPHEASEAQRDLLIERVGWLYNAADDIGRELEAEVERICLEVGTR